MSDPEVLYLDNHLLVVRKPAGLLIQGDRTGDPTLLEQAREYVKRRYNKPGNVFLGLVHRLDRPVSGVVVFARTSKAASRLSEQFRSRRVNKTYLALVEGEIPKQGKFEDQIARRETKSRIVNEGGQKAELTFLRRSIHKGVSCTEINLGTGRHHQIRVQFAHRGYPILGDFKYGSRMPFPEKSIALLAQAISLTHPTRQEEMTFSTEPDAYWPEEYHTKT